ncbi:MFS transporter [Leptodontidium sp. 2 PMI_412]|nr:MFS transporter [Leptodontidium sp. 2 PMI_412]
METNESKTFKNNWRCLIAYLTMSLAHCQCGFSTTSISGFQAMVGFLSVYGHPDPKSKTGWNMGTTPQQLAASFVNFGTMIGILFAQPIGNYLGRRQGLWLASVVSVLGSGLQLKSSNVAGLYARRIIIGMSNGLFMTFAKAYTVESAPVHLKRGIISLYAVWISFGCLLGAVTNKFTEHIHTSWAYKIPLTCHIAIPSLLAVLLVFVPESPCWLLKSGKVGEARRSLAVLRDRTPAPDILEKEMFEMGICIEVQQERGKRSRYLNLDIWRGCSLRRTVLCLAVILSNSSSGIWLMLSYGTVVFQLAGIKQAFQASIYNNLANLLGTIIGLYLCSRMNRRTMLMTGHFVPALCMLGVAVSFTFDSEAGYARMVVLVLLIAHGFFYYAFSSVLSAPLCNELVSLRYQVVTTEIGTAINYVLAWLIAFTMPYFINPRELNWGPKVAYIWAAANVLTGCFFFFFLPETKGLTNEEVDDIFQNPRPASRAEGGKGG